MLSCMLLPSTIFCFVLITGYLRWRKKTQICGWTELNLTKKIVTGQTFMLSALERSEELNVMMDLKRDHRLLDRG